MQWLILAGAAVLLVILLAWVIWGGESTFTVKTAMARVQAGGGGNGEITLQATGYVTARRYATVSSKVMGKVEELLIEEGDHVEVGQVLARLDDSNASKNYALAESQLLAAEAQVNEARAFLKEAELAVKRKRVLFTRQLISQSELDTAEAAYRSLQARLQTRQAEAKTAQNRIAVHAQELEDFIVRAPFAGVVVAKNAQPGEMISPMSAGGFTRTGICSIVDMSSLEIEVDVNEAFINRVRAGQPVRATLDAYPDWQIQAKVAAIIPTADRQKATVKVRIAFDELDSRILPDMGIKVAFFEHAAQTEGGQSAVMLVPEAAVLDDAGKSWIFVFANGKAQKRQIRVQANEHNEYRIVDGLKPGETYIKEIPEGLFDGATVVVQK